jgi:small subunit ribosomal protein S7
MEIKIFNKWDSNVIVNDPGLKNYINLRPVIVPRNFGRHAKRQFYKSQMNIVERLMNRIFVAGHRGKKHLITSGKNVGKTNTAYRLIKRTFTVLEERTKKNPMEVLVRAIENTALREEITSFQVGGIIVRKAVITAPQRRVDLALRLMVQGSYQKAFSNPKGFADVLAEEILAAYNHDSQNSYAIREKERIEREAGGAR